jgi:hypothetical protein
VKKKENKTVFSKETVECLHVIFWPGSQRRFHCHTAKLEPNWRVIIDWVPLLVTADFSSQILTTSTGRMGSP